MKRARSEGRAGRADKVRRCAIYTRVSTDHGLEQDFNSLDAQREACEAYIKSQASEGWTLVRGHYDDGGFSGGSLERPALQQLLDAVRMNKLDIIVVYKVDRLTRSLADFAKLVELFDAQGVSFVSVTQSFNTTTSMGRLTLNVLLSFAQFEREVTGERIRDKIAASKKKGHLGRRRGAARLSGRRSQTRRRRSRSRDRASRSSSAIWRSARCWRSLPNSTSATFERDFGRCRADASSAASSSPRDRSPIC